jgi:hypothetical protein
MHKLSYYNARYHMVSDHKPDIDISDLIREIDPKISPVEISRIASLIIEASRQKFGTILIFGKTKDIMDETERLTEARVGIGIDPLSLDHHRDILPSFVSIDRALLVDTKCSCCCIGAILDGDAAKGSVARGARFNSSLNYIKRRNALGQKLIAIVISEDGTTDAISEDSVTRLNV